jgi:30S ribosomal protein S31
LHPAFLFVAIKPIFAALNKSIMGRGDKKTKKGKIFKGSFGKSRLARPTQNKKVPVLKKEEEA